MDNKEKNIKIYNLTASKYVDKSFALLMTSVGLVGIFSGSNSVIPGIVCIGVAIYFDRSVRLKEMKIDDLNIEKESEIKSKVYKKEFKNK